MSVLSYDVYSGLLGGWGEDADRMVVINTINSYSYFLAKRDSVFRAALKESEVLLPDGFPFVWASHLVSDSPIISKIAGYDVFLFYMEKLQSTTGRVFLLGSTEGTLKLIVQRLKMEYPNIQVDFFSPPFKKDFSVEENHEMVSRINSFSPDVLFVGMTAPKQEKWVYVNREQINVKVVCSIGAVFDFYACTIERPGSFWVALNMEWFMRMLKEPRRLWKRYLVYSPVFIFDVIKEWISKKLYL